MILTTLTLAAGITLVADLGPGLSLKDTPVYTTNAAPERRDRIRRIPERHRTSIPPVPERNAMLRAEESIQLHVRVEGIDAPMAMTAEELEAWGLKSGDVVPPSLAAKIIEEKLTKLIEEKKERE
jgi:hypothetical protein